MLHLIALALLALGLSAVPAVSGVSSPVDADTCDAVPVPFEIPSELGTDSELAEFVAVRSESYCKANPDGGAWCACFAAGLIRD